MITLCDTVHLLMLNSTYNFNRLFSLKYVMYRQPLCELNTYYATGKANKCIILPNSPPRKSEKFMYNTQMLEPPQSEKEGSKAFIIKISSKYHKI